MDTEKEISESILIPVYMIKNRETGELSNIKTPDEYHIEYNYRNNEWRLYADRGPEKTLVYVDDKEDAEFQLTTEVILDDPNSMLIRIFPNLRRMAEFFDWAYNQSMIGPSDIMANFNVDRNHAIDCLLYLMHHSNEFPDTNFTFDEHILQRVLMHHRHIPQDGKAR